MNILCGPTGSFTETGVALPTSRKEFGDMGYRILETFNAQVDVCEHKDGHFLVWVQIAERGQAILCKNWLALMHCLVLIAPLAAASLSQNLQYLLDQIGARLGKIDGRLDEIQNIGDK